LIKEDVHCINKFLDLHPAFKEFFSVEGRNCQQIKKNQEKCYKKLRIKILLIKRIRFARIFKNSRRGLLRHSNLYDREGKRSSGHPHNISYHFSFIRIVPYRNNYLLYICFKMTLMQVEGRERDFFYMTFSKRERWTSLMVEYRDYIGCFAFDEKKRFFVGGC